MNKLKNFNLEKLLVSWRLWCICLIMSLFFLSGLENIPGLTNDSAAYITSAQKLLQGQIITIANEVRIGISIFLTLPTAISKLTAPFIDITLAAKLFMIILNTVSLFLLFKFCRLKGLNAKLSLLAIFLLAINNRFIIDVACVGIDSVLLFLFLSSIYILTKAEKKEKSLFLYALGSAIAGFSILIKGNGLGMILPLTILGYEISRKRQKVAWREITALVFPFIIFWGIQILLNYFYEAGVILPEQYQHSFRTRAFWLKKVTNLLPFITAMVKLYGPILPLLAVIPIFDRIRRRQELYIISTIIAQWLIIFPASSLSRYFLPTLPFIIYFAVQFPKVIFNLQKSVHIQHLVKSIFATAILINILLFIGLIARFIILPGYRLSHIEYFNRDIAKWINHNTPPDTILVIGDGEGILSFYLEDGRKTISLSEIKSEENIRDFMERTSANYLIYIKPIRTLGFSAAELYNYPKWDFLDDINKKHLNFTIAKLMNTEPKVAIYKFQMPVF